MSYNYTFNHLPLTLTHLTSSQCTIFLFSPWRKCLESWTWRGSQEAASDWTMNMPLRHIHYKTKLNSLSSSLHTPDVNSHYKSCTPGCMLVFPGDCHQVNLTYLEQNYHAMPSLTKLLFPWLQFSILLVCKYVCIVNTFLVHLHDLCHTRWSHVSPQVNMHKMLS